MKVGDKTIKVYYDRSWRIWVAYAVDTNGDQIGDSGYGKTRQDAIDDYKYQASIQQ